MPLFDPANRLFTLARLGKRLPHIALAIPLTPVLVLAGALIGGLPTSLLLMTLFPEGRDSLADQPLMLGVAGAGLLVGSFVGIYGLLWAWLRWFEKRPFWTLGFEAPGALMKYARGFLVGGVMFAFSVGGMGLLGFVGQESDPLGRFGLTALGGVLIILPGWMVQGAAEEVLLRGWLMNVIGARYRPWWGVLISSLLFAVLHGLNPGIGPLPLINLFLFGLFAALYALWEESLWGICAQHTAWNWVQGNVFGMHVSGGADTGPLLLDFQETGPDLITGGAFGPEGGLVVTAVLMIGIAILVVLTLRRRRVTSAA